MWAGFRAMSYLSDGSHRRCEPLLHQRRAGDGERPRGGPRRVLPPVPDLRHPHLQHPHGAGRPGARLGGAGPARLAVRGRAGRRESPARPVYHRCRLPVAAGSMWRSGAQTSRCQRSSAMTSTSKGSVTITLDGSNRSATLPLTEGTIGPRVADIRRLHGELGIFTYDPGYGATAACESRITYIDGDAGVLLYRGYPIEQLAEGSDFIEVAYLLMNGELPDRAQLAEFERGVMLHTMVHEQLRRFFNGFRRDAHPMAVMCGVVGAMSAFYHDSLDINDPE